VRGSDRWDRVRYLSNQIYVTAELGIDLGGDGVTPNHSGGLITGPNGFQNYPVLSSATSSSNRTTIEGSLNGAANTTYTIPFFSNTTADRRGDLERAAGSLDKGLVQANALRTQSIFPGLRQPARLETSSGTHHFCFAELI
jgi:hypothetical protein